MLPRSRLISRLGLALVLTIGAGVVWGLLTGWISMIVGEMIRPPDEHRYFSVSLTGTPYQTHSTLHGVVYHTLDGEPVPAEKQVDVSRLEPAILAVPGERPSPIRLSWRDRMFLFVDPGPPVILWYFVHNGEREAGAGYFTGYDMETNRHLGYLAREGFRPALPPLEEWFPIHGDRMRDRTAFPGPYSQRVGIWQVLPRGGDAAVPPFVTHLIAGNQLWEIDLREHTATVVSTEEDLVSLGWLARAITMPPENAKSYIPRPDRYLACRLPDRVLVLDPGSGEPRTYAVPAPLRNQTFQFYELQDGQGIVTFSPMRDPDVQWHLMVLSRDGEILRQATIPRRPAPWHSQPATVSAVIAVAVPAPVVALFAAPAPYAEQVLGAGERSPVRAWLRGLGHAWPQVLAVFLASTAMATWVDRRHRRLAQPHPVVWALFVFLGGLPGLAGYLVHRSWPVVEPCPSCRNPAPRDRETCMHCGEEFPPPAPQGIEVFAA